MSYNVEIPSENSTVLDLKKELEKLHGFDASLLKLLFNGVILEDSKTLQEYKIQENSIIIMMSSKGKPKNNNPPSNSEPPKQKVDEKKPEEKKPEQKIGQNSQKPQEEKYAQQMSSLLDMGFEKTQAEAAIKAARGQIDLAIEFLYNGIPEGINDNMNDLNMAEGQEEGEEEGEGDDNGEDPIKTVASVAKVLCQNNPGALAELLQSIQQTDPDLLNLLNEHEDEFKALLSQPINESDYRAFQRYGQSMGIGGEGEEEQHEHGGEQGQITINLTPEEQEAIKRLKDLGNFAEADVVQAYIACEKNEELTANYLFEQKMRDDDEMFGGHNNNNGNGQ